MITTTQDNIPGRTMELLSVVHGEGKDLVTAMDDMERFAEDMDADAILSVTATTIGVPTPHGATFRAAVIGTAVRLAPLPVEGRPRSLFEGAAIDPMET